MSRWNNVETLYNISRARKGNRLWSSCISHTFTMSHWSIGLTVSFPHRGQQFAPRGAAHILELGLPVSTISPHLFLFFPAQWWTTLQYVFYPPIWEILQCFNNSVPFWRERRLVCFMWTLELPIQKLSKPNKISQLIILIAIQWGALSQPNEVYGTMKDFQWLRPENSVCTKSWSLSSRIIHSG